MGARRRAYTCFGRGRIKANTRGPFQMTPDELPLCGPAPGLENLWLAEGVPGGILWGGPWASAWRAGSSPTIPAWTPRRSIPGVSGPISPSAGPPTRCGRPGAGTCMRAFPAKTGPRPVRKRPSRPTISDREGRGLDGIQRLRVPALVRAVTDGGGPRAQLPHHRAYEIRRGRGEGGPRAAGLLEMSPMTKFFVRGPGAARGSTA